MAAQRKSARVVSIWSGTGSYGVSVEVAQADHGKWYARCYEWNGYQRSWGKWTEHKPSYETRVWSDYENAYYDHDPVMTWGFHRLQQGTVEGCRYRLPLAD